MPNRTIVRTSVSLAANDSRGEIGDLDIRPEFLEEGGRLGEAAYRCHSATVLPGADRAGDAGATARLNWRRVRRLATCSRLPVLLIHGHPRT
jgi:hypothetical protein